MPTDVILVCAAVANGPTKLVPVIVVPVIAAAVDPPITALSIVPELISIPVTGVVPSSRSSMESKLVLILVPHVSSDAPTSGFVKLYVVVVVSAMSISYAAFCQVLLVADASDHVSDVGETTDQSSAACDASCHVSSVFATSVHVSAVPAIGSHFSMPLAVMLHAALVDPPLD